MATTLTQTSMPQAVLPLAASAKDDERMTAVKQGLEMAMKALPLIDNCLSIIPQDKILASYRSLVRSSIRLRSRPNDHQIENICASIDDRLDMLALPVKFSSARSERMFRKMTQGGSREDRLWTTFEELIKTVADLIAVFEDRLQRDRESTGKVPDWGAARAATRALLARLARLTGEHPSAYCVLSTY